jgi:chromosome segregation ATPase
LHAVDSAPQKLRHVVGLDHLLEGGIKCAHEFELNKIAYRICIIYHICIVLLGYDMTRPGITAAHVAAAAEALQVEGQQPTIRAVRERLGDTGSPNTIQRHLAAWRKARPASASAQELPQALAAAIAAELAGAAGAARAAAQAEIDQAQAEAADLAVAGEALETARDELAVQAQALRGERDTLMGRVDALQAENERLRLALDTGREQAQAAHQAAAVAQAQAQAVLERATRAETLAAQQAQELAKALQEAAHLRGRLEAS